MSRCWVLVTGNWELAHCAPLSKFKLDLHSNLMCLLFTRRQKLFTTATRLQWVGHNLAGGLVIYIWRRSNTTESQNPTTPPTSTAPSVLSGKVRHFVHLSTRPGWEDASSAAECSCFSQRTASIASKITGS